MKITQLSVFAENKPGYVIAPCRKLADAGVEIRAVSLAETARFGILRMIVSDWRQAAKLLEEAGFVVKLTDVLAVEVPDGPRGLSRVLGTIENTALNIEYMYAFPFGHGDKAVLVFCFEDMDKAIQKLQATGITMVAREELQDA
jgi:hypothetical protein